MSVTYIPGDNWLANTAINILGPILGGALQRQQQANENRKYNALFAEADKIINNRTAPTAQISTTPHNVNVPGMAQNNLNPADNIPNQSDLNQIFNGLIATKRFNMLDREKAMSLFAPRMKALEDQRLENSRNQFADQLGQSQDQYNTALQGVAKGLLPANVLQSVGDMYKFNNPYNIFQTINNGAKTGIFSINPKSGDVKNVFSVDNFLSPMEQQTVKYQNARLALDQQIQKYNEENGDREFGLKADQWNADNEFRNLVRGDENYWKGENFKLEQERLALERDKFQESILQFAKKYNLDERATLENIARNMRLDQMNAEQIKNAREQFEKNFNAAQEQRAVENDFKQQQFNFYKTESDRNFESGRKDAQNNYALNKERLNADIAQNNANNDYRNRALNAEIEKNKQNWALAERQVRDQEEQNRVNNNHWDLTYKDSQINNEWKRNYDQSILDIQNKELEERKRQAEQNALQWAQNFEYNKGQDLIKNNLAFKQLDNAEANSQNAFNAQNMQFLGRIVPVLLNNIDNNHNFLNAQIERVNSAIQDAKDAGAKEGDPALTRLLQEKNNIYSQVGQLQNYQNFIYGSLQSFFNGGSAQNTQPNNNNIRTNNPASVNNPAPQVKNNNNSKSPNASLINQIAGKGFAMSNNGEFGNKRSDHSHAGTDYLTPNGTNISAPNTFGNSLKVLQTGHSSTYGNYVDIGDYVKGHAVKMRFAHLADGSIKVKSGDNLTPGTLLAQSGNSGRVSGKNGGYHLHLEVEVDGKKIDPEKYYDTVMPFLNEQKPNKITYPVQGSSAKYDPTPKIIQSDQGSSLGQFLKNNFNWSFNPNLFFN